MVAQSMVGSISSLDPTPPIVDSINESTDLINIEISNYPSNPRSIKNYDGL